MFLWSVFTNLAFKENDKVNLPEVLPSAHAVSLVLHLNNTAGSNIKGMRCTAHSKAFQFCILLADLDVYLMLTQTYHKANGDSSDFLFWMCPV
jgi:hypothetical protein